MYPGDTHSHKRIKEKLRIKKQFSSFIISDVWMCLEGAPTNCAREKKNCTNGFFLLYLHFTS